MTGKLANPRLWAGAVATAVLAITPTAAATSERLSANSPQWSAWGRLITFWSGDRLWMMNADGTARRPIARSYGDDVPSLSPDGSMVADVIIGSNDRSGVLVIRQPGGQVYKRLRFRAPNPEAFGEAQWAPNEHAIAWDGDAGRGDRIWVTNLCNRVRLIGRIWDSAPAWSPDSRRIAFLAQGRLATMAPDGSHRRTLLRRFSLGARAPVWSPDGRAIAFAREFQQGPLEGEGRLAIYVVRPDGSGLRRLAQTPHMGTVSYSLAWSPKSDQIVWADPRGIYAVVVRTGRKRRLTSMTASGELVDTEVAWSPAQRILFTDYGRIYTVLPGGRPVRIL